MKTDQALFVTQTFWMTREKPHGTFQAILKLWRKFRGCQPEASPQQNSTVPV